VKLFELVDYCVDMQHVLKELWLNEDDTTVLVEYIEIRKGYRHKGYGYKIINAVKAYARAQNKKCRLYPASGVGWYLRRLRKIYTRMGFVESIDADGFLYYEV